MRGAALGVDSLLDAVMPQYDVRERHEIWVPTSPDEAYAAVEAVTATEIRLLGPLMAIRTVPGRLVGRRLASDPDAPVIGEFVKAGFAVLAERPGSEIVLGAIGRFWSLSRNTELQRIQGADEFARFTEPGFAKAAMNFTVVPGADGSRIATETRVAGTSRDATRRFRRYWLAIRLGSGAIRRSWLKAIRRRLDRR